MIKSYPSTLIYAFMILISISMTLSSNNWFFTWMGFEISLLGFIPLFATNSTTSEATMKYYLMQTSGSALFLMAFLLPSKGSQIILLMSIMMKLGIFPFFQWLPIVMSSLTWHSCMILTTIQKINPIILLNMLINSTSAIVFSTFSILLSSVLGLNQTLMRPLMAYSSISHTSWIILTTLLSVKMSIYYMSLYFLTILYLFNSFQKSKTEKISLNSKYKSPTFEQILLLIILAGIPPFSIFFFKVNIIFMMIKLPFIMLIIILSTYMSTYYYLSFIIPNMMLKSKQENQSLMGILLLNSTPWLFTLCYSIKLIFQIN